MVEQLAVTSIMAKVNSLLILTFIVVVVTRGSDTVAKGLDSLFQEIGFSPSCVSQTLASCENSARDSPLLAIRGQLQSLQESVKKIAQTKKHPRNCADLYDEGDKESGIRTIYPFSCCENRPVSVYCDQTNDGGKWTVFQHRIDLQERENFFRKWPEYQRGFGNLTGEFWLGLDNIHALTRDQLMELRVDLEDFEGKKVWAKYDLFAIEDAADQYRLHLGTYSGDAGDSLGEHAGHMFSTKDKDNDIHSGNCAMSYRGAWWYTKCHDSNINGFQYRGNHTSYADGINWNTFRGYHHSLKHTKMSLRPKF